MKMPVTFVKLGQYGRMGNQFWQCAVTIAHSIRHTCDYIFPHWQYENDFNILKDKFKNLKEIKYSRTFEEPHFHYAGVPYWPNMNLMGYFQSYKYWQDYGNEIRELLSPKKKFEVLNNTTSIHVRRTDYLVHTGCYNILDMKYYEKAMEVTNTDKYLIFSDDIKWCKRHFIGNKFEFSEGKSEVEDLSLMKSCRNNIIANSSFSWWGAWLNDNSNKIVVAPATWFGPKLAKTHNTKDLIPNEWLKM